MHIKTFHGKIIDTMKQINNKQVIVPELVVSTEHSVDTRSINEQQPVKMNENILYCLKVIELFLF